jgi:hypothetical protein
VTILRLASDIPRYSVTVHNGSTSARCSACFPRFHDPRTLLCGQCLKISRGAIRRFLQRPCVSTAFYVGQVLINESDFKSADTKGPERRFAIAGHSSMVAIAVQQGSNTARDRLIVVRLRSDSKPRGHSTNTGYLAGPHVSRSNPQRQTKSWIRPTGRSAHVCLSIRTGCHQKPNIFNWLRDRLRCCHRLAGTLL